MFSSVLFDSTKSKMGTRNDAIFDCSQRTKETEGYARAAERDENLGKSNQQLLGKDCASKEPRPLTQISPWKTTADWGYS